MMDLLNRINILVVMAIIICLIFAMTVSQGALAAETETIGGFIMRIVRTMGLEEELPSEPTASDYIDFLVQYQVMTPSPAEALVGTDEVAKFFENPIAAAALTKPYLKPVLPEVPSS